MPTAIAIAGPAGGGNLKTRDDNSLARQANRQDPKVGATVSLRLAGFGPGQDVTFAVDEAKAGGALQLSGVTVYRPGRRGNRRPAHLAQRPPGVLTDPNADPGQQQRRQFRLVCDEQPQQPEQPPVAASSSLQPSRTVDRQPRPAPGPAAVTRGWPGA